MSLVGTSSGIRLWSYGSLINSIDLPSFMIYGTFRRLLVIDICMIPGETFLGGMKVPEVGDNTLTAILSKSPMNRFVCDGMKLRPLITNS